MADPVSAPAQRREAVADMGLGSCCSSQTQGIRPVVIVGELLKERCRHLQETIKHLMNTPVPLPIQSSAEEPCLKTFPQQRAGERTEPAGTLLAQAQQNEVLQEDAENLQAQLAADDQGSYCVSTPSQRYEELEVHLVELMDENTRLAEENSHFHGQMYGEEKVQAISCLQTRLEDAKLKLKAMREMAESAEREVKRDHREAVQLFQA